MRSKSRRGEEERRHRLERTRNRGTSMHANEKPNASGLRKLANILQPQSATKVDHNTHTPQSRKPLQRLTHKITSSITSKPIHAPHSQNHFVDYFETYPRTSLSRHKRQHEKNHPMRTIAIDWNQPLEHCTNYSTL
jgi:hypothetical protein